MKLCKPCQDWQHMEWDHGFEKAINKVLGKEPIRKVMQGQRTFGSG